MDLSPAFASQASGEAKTIAPQLGRFLKTREGVFAFGLVLACGLLLAFFTWRTFVDPLPPHYHLDFGSARWIENLRSSPSGYYRKTLYLTGTIDRAWVQVAATDHYYLYVNGRLVDDNHFDCARVTGIYDIKHLLVSGKNVIALYSPRVFYPGNSQVLVRGFFATSTSPLTEFRSDASWKVSTTPDGVIGSYKWYEPTLDDSLWANACETSLVERFPAIQSVGVDPRIFASRPAATWLAPRLVGALDATFEGTVKLPAGCHRSWLQVASTGSFDVAINGRLAIVQSGPARTMLPFAQSSPSGGPVSVAPADLPSVQDQLRSVEALQPLNVSLTAGVPTLLIYDVSRWLRAGDNVVRIHARSETGLAAVLAEGFATLSDGQVQSFATDARWKVREQAPGVSTAGPAPLLGPYAMRPWGPLPQASAGPVTLPLDDLRMLLKRTGIAAAVEAAVLALWLGVACWRSGTDRGSLSEALNAGAIVQVPAAAALLLLWLLSYDVRFATDWCFTPLVVSAVVALLLVSHCLLLFRGQPVRHIHLALPAARMWKLAAFLVVVLLGLWLRARDLNTMSLGSDEMTMIANADGVLASGYPHSPRGSFDRLLATYELIPYSLAASSFFFGRTEFAYHLPAFVFGTLTIALIGFVGTRMVDWRVGFISALIYACFPPSLAWARNAIYPAQEQFLSLATFWCFYEAIRGPTLRPRYITLASAGFILGYLSWEGSGFTLPALFVAMFAVRWGDYRWIKDWHLWRCFVVMAVIVVSQLSYRQLTINSYGAVGYSLSDVTSPQNVYRDILVYNPTYYLKTLFFAEVNFVISLFVFGGFLFCWRYLAIRYLVVVLFTSELCYTNLLPFYAPRYCYNAEVLLILAGVAIFFKMRDRIAQLGGPLLPGRAMRALRWSGAAALTAVFVLATNEFVVQSYRLSANAETPALFGRLGYYKTDHRGAARFVANRLEPGDGVVAFMPHIFEFYSGKQTDYSINTFLNEKMNYDGGMERPQFIDKFRGRPLIRSAEEFRDILSRYKRLWVVVPIHDENELMSPDMWALLDKRGRVAFESYREQVILVEAAQSAAAGQKTAN